MAPGAWDINGWVGSIETFNNMREVLGVSFKRFPYEKYILNETLGLQERVNGFEYFTTFTTTCSTLFDSFWFVSILPHLFDDLTQRDLPQPARPDHAAQTHNPRHQQVDLVVVQNVATAVDYPAL